MPRGCHNCRKARTRENCSRCRVVDFDDIKIKSTPHTREEMTAAHADPRPAERATKLPAAAEDALRRLIATAGGLDPISVLLLLHVMHGGTPATFGRFLASVGGKIHRFGASMSRQTAHARWAALVARFKPFEALAVWRRGGP